MPTLLHETVGETEVVVEPKPSKRQCRQLDIRSFINEEDRQERMFVDDNLLDDRDNNLDDDDVEKEPVQEVFPQIKEIQARMEKHGLDGLSEREWNGCASYCPWCEVGTHEPNQVGRSANLVDTFCRKCEEVYCHLCRPVFSLNSDFFCYHCIIDDKEGEFEINPADIPRIKWISTQL